mmetsp:Transcript_33963/g.74703  ORF Transcript_33963/g.74703 Transcript_33963/m.74703 type:complete len:752 (+) Transcript_33963:106-2361(+)
MALLLVISHLQLSLKCGDLGLNGSLLDRLNLGINIRCAGSEEVNNSLVILPVGRAHALKDVNSGIGGESIIGSLELLDKIVLSNTALYGVEEEFTRPGPRDGLLDDALGLHTASLVVKIGEFGGRLEINRQEKLLAGSNLLFNSLHSIVVHGVSILKLSIKKLKLRVEPMHDLELIRLTELDLGDTGGFEDTTARVRVGVHRHLLLINGGVDNDPRSSAELAMGWEVNVYGMLVLTKSINDLGTELEDFASHITATTRESTPVGKDHDRKTLLVEVTNSLSSLEGGIREEDLTGLGKDGLARVGIGRVSRDDLLNESGLDGDSSHGNTSKTAAADNDTLTPPGEVFLEGSSIEETGGILGTGHHKARIIGSRSGAELNITIDGIGTVASGWCGINDLGDKADPLQDGGNTFLVIIDNLMRNTVGVHDLRSAELILGVVYLTSEKLVKSGVPGENHGTLLHLDDTLAKTVEVCTDTDTAAGDVAECKDLIVGTRSLTSNLTTTLKILNTNAMDLSDDIINGPALSDLAGIHGAFRKGLVVLIAEVEVLETLRWALGIVKLDVDLLLETIVKADSGTSVTGDVDTGKVVLTSVLRSLVVDLIFLNAERSALDGNIVGNEDNITALGILGRLHGYNPRNHTLLVGSNGARSRDKLSSLVLDELLRAENSRGNGALAKILEVVIPLSKKTNLEEAEEVVSVSGSNAARNSTLRLDDVGRRVGVKHADRVLSIAKDAELTGNSSDGVGLLNKGSSL